jgi:lipoprotein-anchoring transpeptidase ErfK/SrfK
MRRRGALSYTVIGATGVALVFACCVAIGVTVSGAARLSESKGVRVGSRAARERPANSVSELRAALAASLTFVPAPGATSVAPDAPIVVKAGAGHLTTVRVTSSSGVAVAGALASSGDEWQSSGSLAYGTVYHVTATVSGALHVRAESTVTFRTLTPSADVTASVFPSEGLSVGVGQPVVLRFSQAITSDAARASLLRHLSVTESRPIIGGWYWFSDRELHFRPKQFWPTGERVTVAWNLTGWNASDGAWGEGRGLTLFTVGHARVSFANLSTDEMTVTDNGRTIATYPISGGKPSDPTMGGVHIVLDRSSVVRMVSSTNGIPVNSPDGYDELVYDDVHISDTGEYVHAAPWSVGSQGHTNVSHGCVNLSPANALAFFAFSRVGDIVLVTGSPRPPVLGDHGVMDWDTSWSSFTPANAIRPTLRRSDVTASTNRSGVITHF